MFNKRNLVLVIEIFPDGTKQHKIARATDSLNVKTECSAAVIGYMGKRISTKRAGDRKLTAIK